MNEHDNMKKLMESVNPYQELDEAPRHIGSNERYSPNTNIDITIPQSKRLSIKDLDDATFNELRNAYYSASDGLYALQTVASKMTQYPEFNEAFTKLFNEFNRFDGKFDLGKNL